MQFVQKDFDVESVLQLPLMAHLSTIENGEPRDSPVWFIWEDSHIWLFGTHSDSFIRRLTAEPQCALGVVEFDPLKGILKHVGIRGMASLYEVDPKKLECFLIKYLGSNQKEWNTWFIEQIVKPLNAMVKITPQYIVTKNVSYFKTGPELAKE